MGQYDQLSNDSKVTRMAYRAIGLGKEFNKMQGWNEELDLFTLNDANEEFDETLFNIDEDAQKEFVKDREEKRNEDDVGGIGLSGVGGDDNESAVPTY